MCNIKMFHKNKKNYNCVSFMKKKKTNQFVGFVELNGCSSMIVLLQEKHSPQTMSNVQACIYCDKSKLEFPASLSKFSSIILVLSLKIGTNDCSIFRLNVGFNSFRIGFQNAPA